MINIKKLFDIKRSLSAKINVFVLGGLLVFIILLFLFLNTVISSILSDNYLNLVNNLSNTLQQGVKESLERGQMVNFKNLLKRQAKIKGIINVSQFDLHGKLYMAASEKEKVERLDPAIFKQLQTEKKTIAKIDNNIATSYVPQAVTQDCIRCHHEWRQDHLGGVLSLKYDLGNLSSAKNSIRLIFLVGGLILLVGASFLIFFVMKGTFGRPMEKFISFLNVQSDKIQKGEGDLTQTVEVQGQNEFKQLADNFNLFFSILRDVIQKVQESANELSGSTEDLSGATTDLGVRTNEAAASITETSTTLEEFTSIVKENTQNSVDVADSLGSFNSEVQEKNVLIANVTQTMQDIEDSSKRINSIVNVINDISFQTNLLALNAAVEAARAGDAGRGFAVVASEVRNLAGKTSESSRTIQEIVTQNVDYSEKGLALVNETSEFFTLLTEKIKELVEKINLISHGSKEQSTGIEQINQAIIQLEDVINNNAALVEKLNQTSAVMNENRDKLHSVVDQFQI